MRTKFGKHVGVQVGWRLGLGVVVEPHGIMAIIGPVEVAVWF